MHYPMLGIVLDTRIHRIIKMVSNLEVLLSARLQHSLHRVSHELHSVNDLFLTPAHTR